VPVTILISVAGEFFIKLAEEKGLYDNPTKKVDGVITQSKSIWLTLAEFFASNGFRVGIGIAAAFAIGIGLCYFAIKHDDKKRTKAEEKKFEEQGYLPAPQKPSEGRVFANILNRRDYFSLREAALLLVDRKLSGELSDTASAQLQELKEMMSRGDIERQDELSPFETFGRINRILNTMATGQHPLPYAGAKITRKQLYDLSVKLSLPISGLKP